MRKKENQKFSRKRREKLKKDENRQPESKTAMISVILVASALSISLMARSYALEEKIAKGNFTISNNAVNRTQNTRKLSTNSEQKVNNQVQKSSLSANNVSKNAGSVQKSDAKSSENFWANVINKLKEERKAMLFSNLNNTKAVLLDDMTVGIQFANGLNSFGRAVIERPENMNELKRLVSMELGKDMRIKIIDKMEENKQEETTNKIDLGIDINYID